MKTAPDTTHDAAAAAAPLVEQARQLIERKQFDRALERFQEAAALDPDDLSIACNIGEMLTALRRYDEAVATFGSALERDPETWPAQTGLAHIAAQQGAIADAVALYQDVLDRDPDNVAATVGLADLFGRAGEIDAAVGLFESAVEAHPRRIELWSAYGDLQVSLGRCADAVESFKRAERIDPTSPETHARLAVAHKGLGDLDQATTYFDQALELWPSNWRIHLGRATVELAKGNLAEGWRRLEWRHKADAARAHLQPQWNGQDLTGQTVFLCGEATIADEVMFASCLAEFAKGCGRCIVECQAPLTGLFARSFPNVDIHAEPPPQDRLAPAQRYDWLKPLQPIDVFSALGSLPRFLRPSIDAFPDAPAAFLAPDPDLLSLWRGRLAGLADKLTIGLWWNGFAPMADGKSLAMPELLDGIDRDDVEFVLLAGDVPRQFPQGIDGRWIGRISIVEGIDPAIDAHEAAALIANLDLMVVPPGLSANLAGGLDVPVYCPCPADDWTHLGTGAMPWFSCMRLFTRTGDEPWTRVLADLVRAVHEAADAKSS